MYHEQVTSTKVGLTVNRAACRSVVDKHGGKQTGAWTVQWGSLRSNGTRTVSERWPPHLTL